MSVNQRDGVEATETGITPALIDEPQATPGRTIDAATVIGTLWIWLARVAILALVLGLWEWMVRAGHLEEFSASRPTAIWAFLKEALQTEELWTNAWVTVRETLLGSAIGGIAGLLVGAFLGRFRRISTVVDPYIVMLNSLPRIALAPLFIIWFGIGESSKVALVVSLVFFIMLVNTRSGMQSVDPDIDILATVMGLTERQRLLKVSLPSAVPMIIGGMRLSIAYGLLAAIGGELIAAQAGLGKQLSYYSSTFNVAGVMGILVVLAIVAAVLNWAVGRLESRLLRWQG